MSKWICPACKIDLEDEVHWRQHIRKYIVTDWLIQHMIEQIKFEIRHEEQDAEKNING